MIDYLLRYAKHDRPNLEQLASSREITRSDDKPKLSSNVLFIISRVVLSSNASTLIMIL
jgi:hypothetical protein